MNAWWFTYLGSGIVTAVGGGVVDSAKGSAGKVTYESFGAALLWDSLGQLVAIPAAALCAQVVLRISQLQIDAANRRRPIARPAKARSRGSAATECR